MSLSSISLIFFPLTKEMRRRRAMETQLHDLRRSTPPVLPTMANGSTTTGKDELARMRDELERLRRRNLDLEERLLDKEEEEDE